MAERKKSVKKVVKKTVKKAAKKPAKKTAKKVVKKTVKKKYGPRAKKKIETVMREFSKGDLESGSGSRVTNPKQAKAIAISEAKKCGFKVPKRKKKK
jgi:hypothetical protein